MKKITAAVVSAIFGLTAAAAFRS